METLVALGKVNRAAYPADQPFDPSEDYPEATDSPVNRKERNEIYDGIRTILQRLGLDSENFGTSRWNPFKALVPTGGIVVIKPNLVSEPRDCKTLPESIVTHASVIRPLIDYSFKAVGDSGTVVVADAPQFDSDFDTIVKLNGLKEMTELLSERLGRRINLLDLRAEGVDIENGVIVRRYELKGDPLGYSKIDLGPESMLVDIQDCASRFKGSDYNRDETISHHDSGKHEYSISNTVLKSDLVISVPKLKTHKKAGVTLNLKNLVGINGHKNFIPHYRIGTPDSGGDEMSESGIKAKLLSISYDQAISNLPRMHTPGKKTLMLLRELERKTVGEHGGIVRAGDWYGNDTIWRSILDLYRIITCSSKNGNVEETPSRELFSIIDGIVAGEGNGPLLPKARNEGVVLGGRSFVAVDIAAIASMGHEYMEFPTYRFLRPPLVEGPIESYANSIEILGAKDLSCIELRSQVPNPFQLPSGWKRGLGGE